MIAIAIEQDTMPVLTGFGQRLHLAADDAVQIFALAITADRDASAEERQVEQKSEDHGETCQCVFCIKNTDYVITSASTRNNVRKVAALS